MTNDEILKLALKVCAVTDWSGEYCMSPGEVILFAEAIATAEREACIAICETIANDLHYTGDVERCILVMKSRIIAGRGDASWIVGFVLGAMS